MVGGQVGDGIDGLDAPAFGAEFAAFAADPQDLAGVREQQVGDGGDLEFTDFLAAVTAISGAVQDGNLAPGQATEPVGGGALVVLTVTR